MKNKILILLMSCNQPLYEQEEQACRGTFLKDAEGAEVPYYFYKGTDGELSINEETHTMLLPVSDNLGGTSKKTIMAFHEALKMDNWDYVIKTNVSTWLDIKKIMDAVKLWEGKTDRNIYGARFLANEYSKRVPFPRGHFTILSREMVEGLLLWAPKLILAGEKMGKDLPKTDDTLIGLSLLYHEQKVLGENYTDRLLEVPSITEWTNDITNAPEYGDALAIRCKIEPDKESTADNMRKVHELKHGKKVAKQYRRHINMIETDFGLHSIASYNKILGAIETLRKQKGEAAKATEQPKPAPEPIVEEKKPEEPQKPVPQLPTFKKPEPANPPAPNPEPNKIEMIRERLKRNQ